MWEIINHQGETLCLKPQAFDSFDVGIELSSKSIRHEVVAGMAGAKSLLLFRTLLGPRKVLSQLGDLSIDCILCWNLWFD